MGFNRLSKGRVIAGSIVTSGDRNLGVASVKRTSATVADGASMVATAAHIVTNTIVSATPTSTRVVTTGTAAAIIALLPNRDVGDCTEFTLVNLAAATHALTLTAGTGVTVVGPTVAAATSGTWYVRYDSSSTVSFIRK